jgi:hypothetical protein
MTKLRHMLAGAVIATALTLPCAAFADGHSEIVNAGTHAGFAADSADLAGVRAHLHHTLNCLVGPGGNGYAAAELNPCAQAGNGAIPDAKDAATKSALEAAAAKARDGLAATDLAAAKKAAADVRDMLKKEE